MMSLRGRVWMGKLFRVRSFFCFCGRLLAVDFYKGFMLKRGKMQEG